AHVGDAADDVVEALEVLDVERGVDVDAGVEQLLDVVPALGVARAFDVAVRELVDDDDGGAALESRVEVEFPERGAAVIDLALRQYLEPVEERGGVGASVGLDRADDDVNALGALLARREQHPVGLADSCGRPAEDLEAPAAAFLLLALHAREQRVRIRAIVCDHGRQYRSEPHFAASSARLSLSTFTRGSPKKPSWRPSVVAATSALTFCGSSLRALATRATWYSAAAGLMCGSSPLPEA